MATIAAAIVVIAGAVFLLTRDKPATPQPQTSNNTKGTEQFAVTSAGSTVKYAGHSVYDACSFVSFDTIRSTVNNYQKILDMNGTDKKPSQPLTIEHNYIDRNISRPLGKDSQPRPTATTIGGTNATTASSFISSSDSNCWYGQGNDLSLGIGKTFAKVYVTQKPTPLSADLLRYLSTLKPAGSEGDIDAYVEPATDNGGFYTGIVTNKKAGVVVFVKASTQELGQKATIEASERLAKGPAAPINLTYPLGWVKMPNPCTLFTADDFQQATGKPASALAEDVMGLNEIGGGIMQRSCERLEVERLDGTPISKSNVTIRMGRDENAAKQYLKTLRESPKDTFDLQPLKNKPDFADEAYVTRVNNGKKVTGYEFDMRIGQTVIVLLVDTDSGADASTDAFVGRILPLAQKVADRYRQYTQ